MPWALIGSQPGYEASSDGEIRGPRGVCRQRWRGRYLAVYIGGKTYSVHRLVAEAFHGPDARSVNHIDGKRANNSAANLEYCTPSENMKHAFRIGLQSNKGERHSGAKLSDLKVLEIRRLLAAGKTQTEVAKMMQVSQPAISRANSGARWPHVAAQAVGA